MDTIKDQEGGLPFGEAERSSSGLLHGRPMSKECVRAREC